METPKKQQPCDACKIIGTGAFTAITGYIVYTQYDMALGKAPSDHRFQQRLYSLAGIKERMRFSWRYGPRWLSFLAAGSFSLAVARWNAPI